MDNFRSALIDLLISLLHSGFRRVAHDVTNREPGEPPVVIQ